MHESFELTTDLPSKPNRVYHAWLDSAEHSAFTGSPAEIDPQVGGKFSAWDGYIQGTNLELEPPRRIVQAWRTSEFPAESPDSHLEITLEELEGGTRLRLFHSLIPAGQGEGYRQGWLEYYLQPLREYFAL